ncbi:acyl-CoA synthetase [Phytohabitans aurantiacus]|uniref:acyl-CoA synthetase n=1 Tax=Phytohabitans aurantiacus TaxID=3016789 RepID=UPI002493ACB8|nr:acyl-CoA synthetase [Phytohabitans aurantiacus]
MRFVTLFPRLALGDRPALRFGDQVTTYRELDRWTAEVAGAFAGARRVAVWARPRVETVVAVVAGLRAGVPVVPLNPKAGEREVAHILGDSEPDLVLDESLPVSSGVELAPVSPAAPALIVYTSGTTGPPKGVVLSHGAIASNLDALAAAWQWTADDTVAHGLPLFHVHGLILGMLGPLRLGGTAFHIGRFSPGAVAAALRSSATVLFGVPTMYHRLAEAASTDTSVASALAGARLLVSGSAALPVVDHERIARATGQRVVERYGMTETLMNCAVRADGDRVPGTVGPPLPGVDVRLVDDEGNDLHAAGEVGEIFVRGPNLFLEYLNRPDATAEAMRDGWFRTGDVATWTGDGAIKIVGRRATDLIKSGGYKIGAGEIENVLLDHPAVAEAAVTGAPDADLGERVVAWIVAAPGAVPDKDELAEWVATQLSPHKRPREIHVLDALPRNAMGKVLKNALT